MPAENIRQRLTNLSLGDQDNLRPLFEALVDALEAVAQDVDKVQNDTVVLDTALDAMATQLNADAGVTDTDYAGGASAMTAAGTTEASLDGFIVKV